MGWRIRLLALAALLGCLAFLALARWLAAMPSVQATWNIDAQGQVVLAASAEPLLKSHVGQALISMAQHDQPAMLVDPLLLHESSRWLIDDESRARHHTMQTRAAGLLSQSEITFLFSDGHSAKVHPVRRGLASLGGMFWLMSGLALAVYLVAMTVLLARPSMSNALFSVMSLCQTGNLAFIAIESTMQLALPPFVIAWNMPIRLSLDLITAAAAWHASAIHPRRVPYAPAIAWAAWLGCTALIGVLANELVHDSWRWLQSSIVVFAVAIISTSSWSHRIEPHPLTIALRRFGILAMGTWVLLTVALISASNAPLLQQRIAAVGPAIWYVFFASLLLLLPFLSRSRQVVREFSLLAAVSTAATSLDLLFVAAFSLSEFASLSLALFLSLGLYTGIRQWLLEQLRNRNVLATERTFEKLYQFAREIEAHPERTHALITQLLRDLFQPIETEIIENKVPLTHISGGGSTLVVPLPDPIDGEMATSQSLLMRYSHHGRRLFTDDDIRLADRVLDQLRRAVAFDKAVEQGRNEERLRLAQDLHDDIGARLLTLMYTAKSTEVEDYVRHTLQDLKTLTRGLAAPNHSLLNAAAEWKTDLTHRLTAASLALAWRVTADRDVPLTVVQWSALTRILRELVSNVIAHSQARRVGVDIVLAGDSLELQVTDNGNGKQPQAWSHGLGLGGVRKRARQLGGDVEWNEIDTGGIRCRVTVPHFV